jgi:MtN3 and saliva related transmembrane protein
MDISQIFGWSATFLFSIMIIPQMIKTIKSKDTNGVSLLLFIIFLIANILALTYAIMISQSPLIVKYVIAIITTITYIIIFGIYHKRNKKIIKPPLT